MNRRQGNKSIWEEVADLFYQNRTEDGMALFMEHVAALGQIPAAASWVNPLFDALEQGDYLYAADLLRHEIADRR